MYSIKRIGKLLVFHSILYVALCGLFGVMMMVFLKTLDDIKPKWQLDDSLIGSNPGLSFRPTPFGGSNVINYKIGDRGTLYWIRQLEDFLEPYFQENKSANVQTCFEDSPFPGKVCDFSLNEYWLPCTRKLDYGFGYGPESNGPCVFLKLNRIFGWVPEYYNSSNLPPEMSESLKDHITTKEKFGKHNMVWVECNEIKDDNSGMTPNNIKTINYYPQSGFQAKYFPYTNAKGYLSPLVIVHFEKAPRGVLISIECRAWARNIHSGRNDRRDVVRFHLFID